MAASARAAPSSTGTQRVDHSSDALRLQVGFDPCAPPPQVAGHHPGDAADIASDTPRAARDVSMTDTSRHRTGHAAAKRRASRLRNVSVQDTRRGRRRRRRRRRENTDRHHEERASRTPPRSGGPASLRSRPASRVDDAAATAGRGRRAWRHRRDHTPCARRRRRAARRAASSSNGPRPPTPTSARGYRRGQVATATDAARADVRRALPRGDRHTAADMTAAHVRT